MAELRAALASDETPAPATEPEAPISVDSDGEKNAAPKPEEAHAEPETAPVEKPEEKHESAIDKRFRKLAAQRDEARQEAEKLKRELASKTTPGPAADTVTPAKPAAAALTTEPTPPDSGTWTGTWEELRAAELKYARDVVRWEFAERDRAKQTEQLQAQAKTLHSTWEAKSKTFAESNPEFEDAIGNIGPLVTRAGVADLIKESPVGPEMVLFLHQNPSEVQRMGACKTQVALARELGKLEAQLSTPVSQTPTPAAKKPLPKPPASVGGGSPATVDLEKCDMRTFKREVTKQLNS